MLILSWKVPDYVLRCFNRVEGDNSSSSFNSLIFVWHGTTVMRVSFTKHDWKINISTLNCVNNKLTYSAFRNSWTSLNWLLKFVGSADWTNLIKSTSFFFWKSFWIKHMIKIFLVNNLLIFESGSNKLATQS